MYANEKHSVCSKERDTIMLERERGKEFFEEVRALGYKTHI